MSSIMLLVSLMLLQLLLLYSQETASEPQQGRISNMYQCGERLRNTRGFITTPNFPQAFPLPLACRWIFYAPPGKKIVLYFTQYYLRELFNVVEYDYYVDESDNVGRYDVGNLRIQEDKIVYLQGFKPYVVLTFRVVEMGNLHIRVGELLLDVYGFNITYEVMDAGSNIRTDVCSVFTCSYLGRCIVDKDFTNFKCDCFPGYWGDVCQYGPFCNPPIGPNLCNNGGKCRYFWGSMVNKCDCPPGYEGVQCDFKKKDHFAAECEVLGCMQRCESDKDGVLGCVCDEGYKLGKDNKSCTIGLIRVYSEIRFIDDTKDNTSMECPGDAQNQLNSFITIDDFSQNFEDLNISHARTVNSSHYFLVYFMADKHLKREIELFMHWIRSLNISLCGWQMDPEYLGFSTELALHSMTLVNYDQKPTQLGGLLTLVCSIKGSPKVQFFWFKDGTPINIHRTQRNLWENRVPMSDEEKHRSVLNIDGTVTQDQGMFSCIATDQVNEERKFIKVDIVPSPSIMITPLRKSVAMGTSLTISCVSFDDTKADFKYIWLKNGQILHMGKHQGVIEDIAPTGSRLKLLAVQKDANYTCMVETDKVGKLINTSLIYVINGSSYCPGETNYGISWDNTTNGIADVKSCPGATTGYSTRKCTCKHKSCTWDVPDFSNCSSRRANSIHEMVITIELGYGNLTLDDTISHVQNFTQQLNMTSLAVIGDMNLMGLILWKLQEYKSKYSLNENQSFSLIKMLNVLDFILNITDSLSAEQKQHIGLMPYLFKIVDHMKDVSPNLYSKNQSDDTFHNIDFAMDKRLVYNTSQPPVHFEHQGVTVHAQIPVIQSGFYKMNFKAFTFKNVGYNNLTQMNNLFLNSMVVKISVLKDYPPFMHDIANTFTVKFQNQRYLEETEQDVGMRQNSYCASWKFTKFPIGEWDLEECKVVEASSLYTICECSWSGVYAVVTKYITEDNKSTQKSVNNHKFAEVLLLPVFGYLLYIFFYIALCTRNMKKGKAVTAAQLNFYVVMIVFGVVLYNGTLPLTNKVICLLNRHAVEVLYLAALSSFITESLTNFIKFGCQKLDQHHVICKVICLWVVPIVFVLSTTAEYLLQNPAKEHNESYQSQCLPNRSDLTFLCCASIGVLLCVVPKYTSPAVQTVAISTNQHHIWLLLSEQSPTTHQDSKDHSLIWWPSQVSYFQPSLSNIALLFFGIFLVTTLTVPLLLQILTLLLFGTQVAVTMLSHKKSKEHLRFQMFQGIRYLCTVILLNLLISCVVFRNTVPLIWTSTLNLMIILIIWAPVTSFIVQPEEDAIALPFGNICKLWWSRCLKNIPSRFKMKKSMSSSTFRAFVRPETLSSLHSKSEDSDEVFQRDQKYTLDHKAHLSSLLGSSSTEEGSRQSSLVEFPLLSGKVPEAEVNGRPRKATCYIKD